MHQILYPLIIVTVLQIYASKENPLTISEVVDLVNAQYAPFTEKEKVMNRSTVTRTLESLAVYTEMGNLLNFKVVEQGTPRKKKYYIIPNKTTTLFYIK